MEGKYYIKTALLNLFIQEQFPRSALKHEKYRYNLKH